MSDIAIRVSDLSKRFRLPTEKRNSFKERFVRGRSERYHEFWALRDVTFDVERGTTFGLIGHNGSGKSTLLKMLAGVYRPTSGSVSADGRVSALLELGAGFHGDLTGRENIYLNGAILGMSRRQIDAAMDRIVDFAGIGEFIDSPVKVYSSGMYVRLGFSIAVTVDPEILIVDEIIAVGDEEFQRKCFDHLHNLRKRGTTIVLVSHAMGLVSDLCDNGIWLDHGKVRSLGDVRGVVDDYLLDVNARESGEAQAEPHSIEERSRRGSGEVRITDVEWLGPDGNPVPFLVPGEPCTVRMRYRAAKPVENVVFGLGFVHESGATAAGPNSGHGDRVLQLDAGSGSVDFQLDRLPLQPGTYLVSTAIVDRGHVYDYVDRGFELRVRSGKSASDEPGLVRFFGTWSLSDATGTSRFHERRVG